MHVSATGEAKTDKTNHPISSNSQPSATANKAIHNLKIGGGGIQELLSELSVRSFVRMSVLLRFFLSGAIFISQIPIATSGASYPVATRWSLSLDLHNYDLDCKLLTKISYCGSPQVHV